MKTRIFCVLALLGGTPLVLPTLAQPSAPAAKSNSPGIPMATPPPALPVIAPQRPERPAANDRYVWVPGHYRPQDDTWTWVNGGWHLPPTDISVWIEPVYDAANKLWFKGYWQPDVPAHSPAPATPKKQPNATY